MKALIVTDAGELEALNEISVNHRLTLCKTWPDDGRRFVRDVRGNDLPWQPWGEWLESLKPVEITVPVRCAAWTKEQEARSKEALHG